VETRGNREDETLLHQIFVSSRLRGEWFSYGDTLRELILYLIDGGDLKEWLNSWSSQ
jgi:hypothetical protein